MSWFVSDCILENRLIKSSERRQEVHVNAEKILYYFEDEVRYKGKRYDCINVYIEGDDQLYVLMGIEEFTSKVINSTSPV